MDELVLIDFGLTRTRAHNPSPFVLENLVVIDNWGRVHQRYSINILENHIVHNPTWLTLVNENPFAIACEELVLDNGRVDGV